MLLLVDAHVSLRIHAYLEMKTQNTHICPIRNGHAFEPYGYCWRTCIPQKNPDKLSKASRQSDRKSVV